MRFCRYRTLNSSRWMIEKLLFSFPPYLKAFQHFVQNCSTTQCLLCVSAPVQKVACQNKLINQLYIQFNSSPFDLDKVKNVWRQSIIFMLTYLRTLETHSYRNRKGGIMKRGQGEAKASLFRCFI